jgi:hypothetical protein
MNREQAEFAEFSKQSKERKVAIEQEKNRINEAKADEFRKNQLKKKTFENYKGKYDDFKEAQAKGLTVGKKQRTPGPTLQDLMKDGPNFSKSKGDTPANNMRGKQSLSKVGVNLFDSGNSPDSGVSSSDERYKSAKTSRKMEEYEGSTGSNKSKSAVVSPVPYRYDEDPVNAEEVKEFTTEYQRFIGSESNQSFVQEHATEILTAQQLLVNETGKAKDVLAPDVFETLKSIKILRVTDASRADTVLDKINTLVEADKILQKSQSPFKARRSTRNKAVHAIPIDEIPEKREEKVRVMKDTVMPETMRPASASGPRK